MQSARITTKVRLDQIRERFDFDNCPADRTGLDRFYLRITQGMGGHVGEDDFVLGVTLDGTAIPKIQSSTGLYSQAISFCRRASADKRLRVELDGVEEDLIWDDIYTPASSVRIELHSEP